MQYRTLGQTDIQVSVIAMGTWAIVDTFTWGEQDETDARTAIKTALDTGVNFFDTAEGYGGGSSEEFLGKVLAPHRQNVVIATKVSPSNLAPDDLRRACEASLKRLQTDYIDLYQIHWPSHTVPMDKTLQTLEELKTAGKIRAIGVSNFGSEDLSEALSFDVPITTNQVPYSLLWRAIEYDIQPKCIARNVGILAYSPLMQGLLTGKFTSANEVPDSRARTRHFSDERPHARHGETGQEAKTFDAIAAVRKVSQETGLSMVKVALAWVMHQSGVTSVIAGARNPDQIRQNSAAADVELSAEVVETLNQATAELKQAFGPNPDMWQSESRYR